MLMDLSDLDKAFKKAGAEMFLLYGTALGAYRDGKFLPGDDDLDVGSFDIEKRDEVANHLRSMGFAVSTGWDENYPGHWRESQMIHADHHVHVDAFFFRNTEEGFVASRGVEEEPFVKLPPNTSKDFQQVSLYNEQFNVLSPIEEHLAFFYDDWRNPKKKDHGKLYHDLRGEKFEVEIYGKK